MNQQQQQQHTELQIHEPILEKLNYFIKLKKIPNIIFHGSSGCGKNTILSKFLTSIYQGNAYIMKNYIMTVNCAYGRGIRFIREDLKFFAKTNVDLMDGERFKTIVLLNAEKLTIDAQSALRRCIELFCHSTRFFIVVDDKNKLLKPILSRFCDIYIPDNADATNLHQYNLERVLGFGLFNSARITKLSAILNGALVMASELPAATDPKTYANTTRLAEDLYEKGYCALDVIKILEMEPDTDNEENNLKKYEILIAFSRVKREFRNEKLLMLFILYFMQFRSELDLKNIAFI
jgi:hypothetical protein